MQQKTGLPVTRNGLFYGEEEFQLECDLVESYMTDDLHQTVVLYEVDREKTNVSEPYQENTNGTIAFKPPKELPCTYEIGDSQTKAYNQEMSNAVYAINGNLSVTILVGTLKKYGCDIRRGDYLAVLVDNNRLAYFVVTNDGRLNSSNSMFIGAYKPAFRKIEATPCPEEEFKGI